MEKELYLALKKEHEKRLHEQVRMNGISEHFLGKCETCELLKKYKYLEFENTCNVI